MVLQRSLVDTCRRRKWKNKKFARRREESPKPAGRRAALTLSIAVAETFVWIGRQPPGGTGFLGEKQGKCISPPCCIRLPTASGRSLAPLA